MELELATAEFSKNIDLASDHIDHHIYGFYNDLILLDDSINLIEQHVTETHGGLMTISKSFDNLLVDGEA